MKALAGWFSRERNALQSESYSERLSALAGLITLVISFVAALRIATQISYQLPALWSDLHVGYAVNFWSDPNVFIQVRRVLSGQPLYGDVFRADSWTYGPAYPYILATVDRLFERMSSIVTLRLISASIGLAAAVPIALAVMGAHRSRYGKLNAGTPAAVAFTVVTYLVLDSRALGSTALHPDVVTFFAIAASIAAVCWYPMTKHKGALLALLVGLSLVDALSKLNTAPLPAFFLGALAVQRQLRWSSAAKIFAGYAGALIVFFVLAPANLREWTIVIPAHHWYSMPWYNVPIILRDWRGGQPYQAVAVAGTVFGLVYLFVKDRSGRATAWAVMLAGTLAAGYQAMAKQGGGTNDLWIFYLACLIFNGVLLDEFFTITRKSGSPIRVRNAAAIAVLAYVLVFPAYVETGLFVHFPLLPEGRATLARSAARLQALCKPGRRIIVLWFPDPLFGCKGATFPLWNSVGEIDIAGSHGYRTKTLFSKPVTADVLIVYRPNPPPFKLGRGYVETAVPIYDGWTYGYGVKYLDVYTLPGIDPP